MNQSNQSLLQPVGPVYFRRMTFGRANESSVAGKPFTHRYQDGAPYRAKRIS